ALLVGASGAGASLLPGPATVDLAALAPGTAGLAGLRLRVGAVGAGATLDGCERDESRTWLTRGYGVAGLVLEADSPAVVALRAQAQAAAASAGARAVALQGPLASTASSRLLSLLGGVLQTSTATVTVDVPAAVAPLLQQTLTDGVVSVDLAAGRVRVDLAALAGGLDGRAPGTRVTLDAATAAAVSARVDALLGAWSSTVAATVDATVRAATVVVTSGVTVLGLGLQTLTISGTLGGLAAGQATSLTRVLVSLGDATSVLSVLAAPVTAALTGAGGVLPVLTGTLAAALPPVAAAASA
ncbi:choice-of-anchor G family protein, partial [Aquipuribacter hungaricus]